MVSYTAQGQSSQARVTHYFLESISDPLTSNPD